MADDSYATTDVPGRGSCTPLIVGCHEMRRAEFVAHESIARRVFGLAEGPQRVGTTRG
jgi:hypothetical protein